MSCFSVLYRSMEMKRELANLMIAAALVTSSVVPVARAVGYKPGDLRGAVSIRQPLDSGS